MAHIPPEMNQPTALIAWAMSVQMDSPLYNTAHAVCVVRGEDPWMSHYGHIFGQLPRWQKVLIETALLKVIMA